MPHQNSKKKKEKLTKNEDSLRSLWEDFKHDNICIMGRPEEKKESKEMKTYLKK